MKLTQLKKLVTATLATVLFVSLAMAQEARRNEVSGQATGFFPKDTDGNGVSQDSTYSLGAQGNYRFFFNRYIGADGTYGWARNTLHNFTSTGAFNIQSDVHQASGSMVVRLPGKIIPYGLAGGGALIFRPTENDGGLVAGAARQTKAAFVYGGGVTISITEKIGIRGEYRGFVYKQPDFGLAALNSDKFTHTAQPAAGIVFRF